MTDSNPYQPPKVGPERPGRFDRRRPIATLLRVVSLIAGFAILAGPTRADRNIPYTRGQVALKVLGVVLLLGAFLPFGRGRPEGEGGGQAIEDL